MNFEIGPILTMPDPLYPGFTYKIWNSRFARKPEIVSFTQILRENYIVEYGNFIRSKIHSSELPVPFFSYYSTPEIVDVTIEHAFYDRIDSDTFAMYVICEAYFYDKRHIMDNIRNMLSPVTIPSTDFRIISRMQTFTQGNAFVCEISWMIALCRTSALQNMMLSLTNYY